MKFSHMCMNFLEICNFQKYFENSEFCVICYLHLCKALSLKNEGLVKKKVLKK